ncbi:MAG: RNA 3'-terminal phosphate cyclase [Methanomassiliicoccaceae archaeon]|jgi:RNA 3'-phosphate cyclase|nr:RNA 3'-terminal phosphate cyclase [Methanomassiliicoccaceae archaeon]
MLEIDSSKGEGGGQVVRSSVALSAITGIEARLTRIRENRPTNGLSKQHCVAVKAVADMTGSEVIGNHAGSRELVFRPGGAHNSEITLDIGTAGSISLVLQAVMLAGRNHKKKVTVDVRGGTNVMWAPPIDSYQQVLFPLMERMGIHARLNIVDRGFYPDGGGRVVAELDPIGDIRPLVITDLGELRRIEGVLYIQCLKDGIKDDMVSSCEDMLDLDCPVNINVQRTAGSSKGAGLSLVAVYDNGRLGSNVLTTKGHPAKQAGEDVAKDLLKEMGSGATMDVHTADQLLPYMAMANGLSEFTVSRISRHLLSQMDTLETFLDVRFGVERKGHVYNLTVNPGEKK